MASAGGKANVSVCTRGTTAPPAHSRRQPAPFRVPNKLWDREKERYELLRAYEQGRRFVLISGCSGTGKSRLAQSLGIHLQQRNEGCGSSSSSLRVYFISGKFDQLGRPGEPFQAFVSAWTEWVDLVLSSLERTVQVKRIQEAVDEAVDPDDILLLMELIPSLEKILNKPSSSSPPSPHITDTTAAGSVSSQKHRFKNALTSFVRTMATAQQQLILLLDDLQWADPASLEVLLALASLDTTTPRTPQNNASVSSRGQSPGQDLLLLGTCRDNEVPAATHPLAATLRALEDRQQHQNGSKNDSPAVTHIHLQNHSRSAVKRLVAQWVQLPETSTHVQTVADKAYAVTAGNMLFLLHFMQLLLDKGLLVTSSSCEDQDANSAVVVRDKKQLQSERFTSDIVGFCVEQIQRCLPLPCQKALTIAAGMGAQLEAFLLRLVLDEAAQDASPLEVLAPAIEKGLLLQKDEKLSFAHDRIQQAAYSMLPAEGRAAFHLELGRRLRKRVKEDDALLKNNKVLFVLVDQLNLGVGLLNERPQAQYELAALNLRAAKRVIATSSFGAAAEYLHQGIALLRSKDHWREEYGLSLDLLSSAAEVAYSLADFARVDQWTREVLTRARTFHDQLRSYATRVYSLGAQNRMQEALDLGFDILNRLGESFPRKVTRLNITLDLTKTYLLMRRRSADKLLLLPLMRDPERLAAMQLLNFMLSYSYQARPEVLLFLIFRMVRLTVRHGLCAISAIGFAGYGIVLIGILGDIDRGEQFGQLALQILKIFHSKEWIPRVHGFYYTMVYPWTRSLSDTLVPLLDGYRVGLQTGDIEYAMMCSNFYCMHAIHAGIELTKIESEMRYYCGQMEEFKQDMVLVLTIPTWQLVLNLIGQAEDPLILTGETMDQESTLKKAAETNNVALSCVVYTYLLFLECLFGNFEVALDAAVKSSNVDEEMLSLYDVVVYHTFAGLVHASLAHKCKRRRKHTRKLRRHLNKVAGWAKHAPRNSLHKQWLLEAELVALRGHRNQAMNLFRLAIEDARRNDFVQMQAVANERAGLFLRHCGDENAAGMFYEQARSCYRQWGATAKLGRLVDHY